MWPVARAGEPLRPPRRVTSESAHAPSWQGDSRHILYQSLDQLRIVDIETGETTDGAARPEVDARDSDRPHRRACRQAARHEERRRCAPNVDITIDRQPASSASRRTRQRTTPGGNVVDASNLTVMPGLTGVPLASAEGLRRRAGPRAGWRSASPRCAARATRRTKPSRIARPTKPACARPARLRHRLPDGVEPRLLQDGHRHLERRASSRWSCSAPKCCSTI